MRLTAHSPSLIRQLRQPSTIAVVCSLCLVAIVGWSHFGALRSLPGNPGGLDGDSALSAPQLNDRPVGGRFDFDPFAVRMDDPVAEVTPASTQPSRLNLTVEGIFHLPARDGGAVMMRDRGMSRSVRRGEEIEPGVILLEIHPDHIVVDNQGRRETLDLMRDQSSLSGQDSSTAHARVAQRGGYTPARR